MNNWYQTLIKPSWAPPSFLFGPVWTVLYIIIFATYATVFYKVIQKQIPAIVALPFILNIIFNLAFTPLQFGLKSNLLASIDIILVLATLIWALIAVYPHIKVVSFANIPYLIWVIFATVLQLTILKLNW
jgi:translocator protein